MKDIPFKKQILSLFLLLTAWAATLRLVSCEHYESVTGTQYSQDANRILVNVAVTGQHTSPFPPALSGDFLL